MERPEILQVGSSINIKRTDGEYSYFCYFSVVGQKRLVVLCFFKFFTVMNVKKKPAID